MMYIDINRLNLTLVAQNDPELSDQGFSLLLEQSVASLRRHAANAHGPNAFRILGERLVRCSLEINRDTDGVSTVDVTCRIPNDMSQYDLVEYLVNFWKETPLGTNEFYIQ